MKADFYLLIESTYGNRDHRPLEQTLDELVDTLNHALVDGEEEIASEFAAVIDAQLHWPTRIPAHGETIQL